MYELIGWKDEVRVPDHLVKLTDQGDGTSKWELAGTQRQAGTNQSGTNFGHMDQGINAANLSADALFTFVRLMIGHGDKTIEQLEAYLLGKIAEITGGDVTAAKAATLTQILGIVLGGTGASTAAGARTNLDVPSNTDLSAAAILDNAMMSVNQAAQRDLDRRLAVAEAQLAALA